MLAALDTAGLQSVYITNEVFDLSYTIMSSVQTVNAVYWPDLNI